MRQLPDTSTDQVPRRSPFNSWRRQPGIFIAVGFWAASSVSRRLMAFLSKSGATSFEWPFLKTSFSPLCLKDLITDGIVRCHVTPVNQKMNPLQFDHFLETL